MLINRVDNVEVNIEDGHKYAIADIKTGENVIKYGYPIGHATCDIKKGDHVHSHNMKTNLSDKLEYEYAPDFVPVKKWERFLKKRSALFLGLTKKVGCLMWRIIYRLKFRHHLVLRQIVNIQLFTEKEE